MNGLSIRKSWSIVNLFKLTMTLFFGLETYNWIDIFAIYPVNVIKLDGLRLPDMLLFSYI